MTYPSNHPGHCKYAWWTLTTLQVLVMRSLIATTLFKSESHAAGYQRMTTRLPPPYATIATTQNTLLPLLEEVENFHLSELKSLVIRCTYSPGAFSSRLALILKCCADDLVTDYTHDQAVRDMDLGFKAALWMALLGFLASGLHRHMDSLDQNLVALQDWGLQGLKHAR